MNRPRRLIVISLLVSLILGMAAYQWQRIGSSQTQYKTLEADRGEIVQSVSANGTLNPVVLVNVGTPVSGTVKKLHADFNQRVAPGQILAELDPALFRAQLAQSEANLAAARANLRLSERKAVRARDLQQKKFISDEALDQAVQVLDAARAQLSLAQAQVEKDRTNLNYAVIRSPISGVVVARNVDIGQTVAASFQTPTLFQIAQDLRQMQIDSSVAEADIGLIQVGQAVDFGVDAYPDSEFHGQVKQVRLNPTIQQNVVTYNVVVAVNNPDGKLMPGMTAHVRIIVNRKPDVLRIANATLRFKPEQKSPSGHALKGKGNGPVVYRLQNGKPYPVEIKTGISDGSFTEVTAGEVKAGTPLISGELRSGKSDNEGGFRIRLL
ncbi:MAG: efflux RND transporter periplasmic adaptor subunit [Burkholderiales bacterium]